MKKLFFVLVLGMFLGNVVLADYTYSWLGTTSSDPFTSTNWSPNINLSTTTWGSQGIDNGTTNFLLSKGTITSERIEVNGQNTIATMSGGVIYNIGSAVHVGQTSKGTAPTSLNDAPVLNVTGGKIANSGESTAAGIYLGFKTCAIMNVSGTAEIQISESGRFVLDASGGDTVLNQTGGSVKSKATISVDLSATNKATYNLSGGTLDAPMRIENAGEFNVSGGSYTGALTSDGGASLTLSGGTIEAPMSIANAGKFNVSGGSYTGALTSVGGGASLTLSGGTINNTSEGGLTVNSLKVTGGTYNGTKLTFTGANLTYQNATMNADLILNNDVTVDALIMNDETFDWKSRTLTLKGTVQMGGADGSGNPTLLVGNLSRDADVPTALYLYSGTLRSADMIGNTNGTFQTVALKGGTLQTKQWGGKLTNEGTTLQIANSVTADYSSIGTMTFRDTTGSLVMKAGSVVFDLAADGTSDSLNLYRIRPETTNTAAAGTVTLTGGKFIVNASDTRPAEGTTYTILDNAASFTRGTTTFTEGNIGRSLTVRTGTGLLINEPNDGSWWTFAIQKNMAGTNAYYTGELTYGGKMTDSTYNGTSWSNGDPLTTKKINAVVSGGNTLTAGNVILTDSNLTIKDGGTLNVNAKRFFVDAQDTVSATLYLENDGTIQTGDYTFGPVSADAKFVMTGGTVKSSSDKGGLRVDYGSAILSGGTIERGHMHIGTGFSGATVANSGYVRITGTANIHLNALNLGYNGGQGGLLEIDGGTLSVRGSYDTANKIFANNYDFGISSVNGNAISSVKISDGTVMAQKVRLGTVGTGTLSQSGGSLSVQEFQLGTKGTFNLTGGTFAAKNYSGDLVNNGATVSTSGRYEYATDQLGNYQIGTFDTMTLTGKYTQQDGAIEIFIDGDNAGKLTADQIDVFGGDLFLNVLAMPTDVATFQLFDANTMSLAFENVIASMGRSDQWLFNAETGSLTYFTQAHVPEPASWSLLLLGLAYLFRRRK